MILKIFRTSLNQIQHATLIRGSVNLFSNDDKQNGFKKFNRRKNSNDNNSSQPDRAQKESGQINKKQKIQEQPTNKNNDNTQDSNKTQSTQNFSQGKPEEQTHGRHRFKRRNDVHSQLKKVQNNNSQTFKKQNTKEQPTFSSKQNMNTQHKNQTQLPKSFSNFIRKKQPTNSNKQKPIQEERKNLQTNFMNSNSRKQPQKQDKKSALNNQPEQHYNMPQQSSGFDKFKRTRKTQQTRKPQQNNINDIKKQQNKIKMDQKQEKINIQTENKKQERQQNFSHFNKFKRTKPNTPKQQEPVKPQPSTTNIQQQKKQPEFTTNLKSQQPKKQQQKPLKSPEQLQKQKIQQQLKQKQQFFKQKILQFKQLKQNETQINKSKQLFNSFYQRLSQKILQITGVDINAKIQPPKFVRDNPILFYCFKFFSNIKTLILLLIAFIASELLKYYAQYRQEMNSQDVLRKIQSGQVFRIAFQQTQVETQTQAGKKYRVNAIITLKNGEIYNCVSNSQFQNIVKIKVGLINSLNTLTPPIIIQNYKKQQKSSFSSLRVMLSLIMFYIFLTSFTGAGKAGKKTGGASSGLFNQSKSKKFQQKVNVKFNDVVGMQKAKQEIIQFIDFLRFPKKYHDLGAKIPRGALLTGPPGTGKTMIAKACAGQSNVPFFTISGSQFIEMYVGVGAQRVRDLFKQAKQAAPSIIFIDQIDAVGKKRSSGFGGGNDERDNTLNQLLVQMDGFKTGEDVIVFAATNQRQVLDPALIRPGRFDRLVQIDLPDIQGRKQIFMVHLRPIVIDQQSTMEDYARRMATLTPGFSGAQIKNLCNQAAIMAARNGNKFVTMHDFELATQRVIGGVQKKSHLITPQTKKVVAYHQCGHGVASWFLQGANPLLKLTIIPRSKGSLGFAQYLPHETQISNKKQLQDSISVILAGRITQQVFFGRISTGAYDDLQKAYNIAKKLVTQYGMNQHLGWLSFEQSEYAKYYSRQTQKKIDLQIIKIIKTCTDRTRQLITSKKDLIQKLASKLLEVETIDLTQISDILGQRPFKPNKQYEEYLSEYKKIVKQQPQQKKEQNKQEKGLSMKTGRFSQYLL